MGLFDFLLSEEKKIKKHHRRLNNRDAQPEDRELSARWLADNGSPQALLALLSRFDMQNVEHQLKDAGEKELVYALIAEHGDRAIEPLVSWLRVCKQVAQPLRLLEDLTTPDQAVEVVFGLLEQERKRDDFKPGKKKKLLIWLADQRHDGAIEAAMPFLADFDEGVRYAAAEVIIGQEDEAGREPLLEVLSNPEEESNRLKVRIAEVFANRRWSIAEVPEVADRLPNGYAVRDVRIVSA